MNAAALLFLAINGAALLLVPRRYALIPLLLGACYIPITQAVQIGPISFSAARILIIIGLMRLMVRGERVTGGLMKLDWLLLSWAAWACFSSLFHEGGSIENRLGMVCDYCGAYFLVRAFTTSIEDVAQLSRVFIIVLGLVALEMMYEHSTRTNLFSVFKDVPTLPEIREGRVRASGPFGHAILAGTVGASMLPLMIGAWRYFRRSAALGIVICLTMIVASASSSPIVSAACGAMALFAWNLKGRMRWIRWGIAFGYIALDVVMNAPAYYLLARIDLAGGSTGWHRARLIEVAIEHLSEWWLIGTDYTRHWIPYGVVWSDNHIDVTNYYLKMGVLGGLPLMILFVAFVAYSFALVGRGLATVPQEHRFLLWSLGAAMFAHATTSISVTYFDQSFLFFYMVPAAIASVVSSIQPAVATDRGALAGSRMHGKAGQVNLRGHHMRATTAKKSLGAGGSRAPLGR